VVTVVEVDAPRGTAVIDGCLGFQVEVDELYLTIWPSEIPPALTFSKLINLSKVLLRRVQL
jgi:hypothetical protein